MCDTVQGLVATVQCAELSHFMLTERINTSAAPHGVTGKTLHLANGRTVADTVTNVSGKHRQRATRIMQESQKCPLR